MKDIAPSTSHQRPVKSVLISHVYSSENKGDAAILSVLVSDIRRTFPKAKIRITTFDKVPPREMFEGAPVYQSFMGLALTAPKFRIIKLPYSMFVSSATLLTALLSKFDIVLPLPKKLQRTYDLYHQADLVVGVGGGYLRGVTGIVSTIELALQLHPLVLSFLLRQKVILYSQSIGPFGNQAQEWLAKRILPSVDLIIARENITVGFLKKLGIEKNVVRSVDCAFAFENGKKTNLHRQLGIPRARPIIGITVRKWLGRHAQSGYEDSIARLADYLQLTGYSIVFIPQVTSSVHNDDDRIASRDVYKKMKYHNYAHLLEYNFNHHEIKNIYSGLDLLIGTRFHSVIFALTSYVPTLAIEYEHKTTGIMHDLGLTNWVIKIENVTSTRLTNLMKKLLDQEASYRAILKRSLPPYIGQAKSTRNLLKEVSNG